MKVDQCQPHENSRTACQSSQVVNWVKTKPGLAGNQIPFGGTRFGFTSIGVYNRGIIDTYSSKTKSGSSEGNSANSGLVLTQLTAWDDWQAVQEFLWGWHWSTFKYIGC